MRKFLPAVFITLLFIAQARSAPPERDTLVSTQAACQRFRTTLQARPDIVSGTARVPRIWGQEASRDTLPVFWWKRPGMDPTYPPIAFIHGGPASNSWALLDKWKEVFDRYPGDIVAFDHRGEGCSKTSGSNLDPALYEPYRIRNIVRDLEYLRKEVFKYPKWRIVGHSRGAALVHYYLEMAPQSLEAAFAMGFAIMPGDMQTQYPMFRALGYYRAAKEYLRRYPDDEARVQAIRRQIVDDKICWDGMDDRRLCGPGALDVLGAQNLKNVSSWASLHQLLLGMVDTQSIRDGVDGQLKKDVYGHFNYIVATNSQDFGGPDEGVTLSLKATESPLYVEPFLSEIRYLGDAIAPTVPFRWEGHIDQVRYGRILRFLDHHPGFRFELFGGYYDPIAPLELYQGELRLLADRATFTVLPESGHDGWYDPILLNRVMKR